MPSHGRAVCEYQQNQFAKLQSLTRLHRFFVETHAIDLAGKQLHFGHIQSRETCLLQGQLLASRIRTDRRSQRQQRPRFRHNHIDLFDARTMKGEIADCVRHFVNHIIAIGKQLDATFHESGRRRWRGGPVDALLALLRFELAQGFQFAEHDAVRAALMVTLRDRQPDGALVLVERGVLKRVWRLEAVFAFPAHAIA